MLKRTFYCKKITVNKKTKDEQQMMMDPDRLNISLNHLLDCYLGYF